MGEVTCDRLHLEINNAEVFCLFAAVLSLEQRHLHALMSVAQWRMIRDLNLTH